MMRELKANGSPMAALMLAQLRAQQAVPEIKRWFVDVKDMYGWETSRPCALDEGQHPTRLAYEEALRALTGQAVETLIILSDADRKRLRASATADDEDALYVLSRLSPQDALDLIAPKFK